MHAAVRRRGGATIRLRRIQAGGYALVPAERGVGRAAGARNATVEQHRLPCRRWCAREGSWARGEVDLVWVVHPGGVAVEAAAAVGRALAAATAA